MAGGLSRSAVGLPDLLSGGLIPFSGSCPGRCFMVSVVGCLAVLAVLLAIAWSREFRLRKGMQQLLVRLFHGERGKHEET